MTTETARIKSFNSYVRMMYAYRTPEIARHDGWLKIGDTEQGVDKRIRQQTHTADVQFVLEWKDVAMYRDDCTFFRDHDFHDYLTAYHGVERNDHTEWFHLDGQQLRQYFEEFVSRNYPPTGLRHSYKLRDEQQRAVGMTMDYLKTTGGTGKFLWNAKPRFGKTLTAYDLVKRMKARNVLIVTNRPSIANSWYDDFERFMADQSGYRFVSDNEALSGRKGVLTREMFTRTLSSKDTDFAGQICFESLQGLKGSVFFGGKYNKLEWIKNHHMEDKDKALDAAKADVPTEKKVFKGKKVRNPASWGTPLPEDEIDLHGMTADEAAEAVERSLRREHLNRWHSPPDPIPDNI